MLVLQILCRYKLHACRLTCYRQISKCTDKTLKKHYGGGGQPAPPPPPPPPPPPLATLMAGNAKEADIWFGEAAREAPGKFKDLVCLVVFLCWIKTLCITFIVFKCKYMNRYFSSFQKSTGGDDPPPPPRKLRGGGTTSPLPPPPPPPRPPRDLRRLCLLGNLMRHNDYISSKQETEMCNLLYIEA